MELYNFIKWFVMDFINGVAKVWVNYSELVEDEPILAFFLTLFGTFLAVIVVAVILGLFFKVSNESIGLSAYITTILIWVNYIAVIVTTKYRQFKRESTRYKEYMKELEEVNVTKEN